MKRIEVVIKKKKKKRLSEVKPEEKIIGVVLRRSKSIITLRTYSPKDPYPTDFSKVSELWRSYREAAEIDMEGEKNTIKLRENGLIGVSLKRNEYIPSLGQVKDALMSRYRIGLLRKKLGLPSIPYDSWFLTSTVRDKRSVWLIYNDFYFYNDSIGSWLYHDCKEHSCHILAFLKIQQTE